MVLSFLMPLGALPSAAALLSLSSIHVASSERASHRDFAANVRKAFSLSLSLLRVGQEVMGGFVEGTWASFLPQVIIGCVALPIPAALPT